MLNQRKPQTFLYPRKLLAIRYMLLVGKKTIDHVKNVPLLRHNKARGRHATECLLMEAVYR